MKKVKPCIGIFKEQIVELYGPAVFKTVPVTCQVTCMYLYREVISDSFFYDPLEKEVLYLFNLFRAQAGRGLIIKGFCFLIRYLFVIQGP